MEQLSKDLYVVTLTTTLSLLNKEELEQAQVPLEISPSLPSRWTNSTLSFSFCDLYNK